MWFYHAHAFVLNPYFFNIKIFLKYDIIYICISFVKDKYVCMHARILNGSGVQILIDLIITVKLSKSSLDPHSIPSV